MASHGIKDRVAIVGMGCTPFKEHWDKGVDDLALEASNEAFAAAGIDKDAVDAYWLGTAQASRAPAAGPAWPARSPPAGAFPGPLPRRFPPPLQKGRDKARMRALSGDHCPQGR